MHDGSKIVLKKLGGLRPQRRLRALRLLHETALRNEFATGILYVEPDKSDFIDLLGLVDEPAAATLVDESRTRPGKVALETKRFILRASGRLSRDWDTTTA